MHIETIKMHTIWKLYSCCFSAMSFPRHSLMMTAKREDVRRSALLPSGMLLLFSLRHLAKVPWRPEPPVLMVLLSHVINPQPLNDETTITSIPTFLVHLLYLCSSNLQTVPKLPLVTMTLVANV